MRDGLLDVARHARDNEPDTVGYFNCQDKNDPCIFTTYERFATAKAMDEHNNSQVVADFFAIAKPILHGDVIVQTCDEIFAK